MNPDLNHLAGRQSESSALRDLLAHGGFKVAHTGEAPTEELLFGIGGGIGAGYFVYEQGELTSLFVPTRITTQEKGDEGFLPGVCRRLGIDAAVDTSSSPAAAERKLKATLDQGSMAIVWVDARRLSYPGPPASYHNLVVYGYDPDRQEFHAFDRCKPPVVLPAEVLAAAREGEGLKSRMMVVGGPSRLLDAVDAVRQGIVACRQQMDGGFGPASMANNFGLRALDKWAGLLTNSRDKRGWPRFFPPGARLFDSLLAAFDQIENRGSGGSAHRSLYADFLVEAAGVLDKPDLIELAAQFREAAERWGELASALLPEETRLGKAGRLSRGRRIVFEEVGQAGAGEFDDVQRQQDEIRAEAAESWPLDQAAVDELLSTAAHRLRAIHEVETEAVRRLKALVE